MPLEKLTETAPTDATVGRHGRAVVVEDHPILRRMIDDLLAEAGFETLWATTGAAGLRAVRRGAPALVVLDLGLLDPPAREVLAAIRADPATATLPVLLVDGPLDGPPVPGEHERLLAKPFSYAEFVDAVEALVPTGLRIVLPPW